MIHYINGSFTTLEDASLSAFDLGILRGYGVFDYIPSYQGVPFHLLDHLKRLQWSAKQIDLPMPMPIEKLHDLTRELIEKNPPIDAGVRIIITGGLSQGDQLLPTQNSSLIILLQPHTPYPKCVYQDGIKVITTKTVRLFPAVKTTNYLPAILAMKQAKKMGYDDALYLDAKDQILEGTTSNVFFFKEGKLVTCDSQEIVLGVTRSVFLHIAKKEFPIELRGISNNEIKDCEEAFLTSSRKDALPIVQIDNIKIGNGTPGPNTAHLRELFRQYVIDHLKKTSID